MIAVLFFSYCHYHDCYYLCIIIHLALVSGRHRYFGPDKGRMLGYEGSAWSGSGVVSLRISLRAELCSGETEGLLFAFPPLQPHRGCHTLGTI